MASLGIRGGGGNHTSLTENHRSRFSGGVSKQFSRSDQFLPFRHNNTKSHRIYASVRLSSDCSPSSPHFLYSNPDFYNKLVNEGFRKNKVMFSEEKFDEWLRVSAAEIVKELNQSPLLVHVYEGNNGSTKFKTEKAKLENWQAVTAEWEGGETPCPDGVIFVEELKNKVEDDDDDDEEEELDQIVGGGNSSDTKVWGMVIQGRGVECGPACYLLKTSRVGVGGGLGLFCTHFCLMRVKNFRKSALSQLIDCWLLK